MRLPVPVPRASRFEDLDDLTLLACLVWSSSQTLTITGATDDVLTLDRVGVER